MALWSLARCNLALLVTIIGVTGPMGGKAEPLRIGGVAVSTAFPDLQGSLTRELDCTPQGQDLPAADEEVSVDAWITCVGNDDLVKYGHEFIAANRALNEIILSLPKVDSVQGALNSFLEHPNAHRAISDFDESLESFLRNAPIIIGYEVDGRRAYVFSCSVFRACQRPIGEVIDALVAQVNPERVERVGYAPKFLEYALEGIAAQISSNASLDEELRKDWLEVLLLQPVRFDLALSPCFFGISADRLCVYDGAIRIDILSVPGLLESLALQDEIATRAISDFEVPLRFLVLEELQDAQEDLSFD